MEEEKMNFNVLAALRQYTLVSDINTKILEIEKLKDEVEKLSKKENIVIFQKDVDMQFVKACNGSMFHSDAGTLDKISISCSLSAKNNHCSSPDFFIRLYLTSRENTYSFIIAKNKGAEAGYLVQAKEDELCIEDGGGTFVRFFSAKDFREVINSCDESIARVNDFLIKDKLIAHINAPIVCFD